MAGKPSSNSEAGARFLAKFPGATAEQVARASGLTASAVQKSAWWKARANAPAKKASPK